MITSRISAVALALLNVLLAKAAESDETPYAMSTTNAGVSFIIVPYEVTTVPKTTQKLGFGLQSTNETPAVVWLPKAVEYRCRVRLFSTNGTPVTPAKVARNIGSKFDSIPKDGSNLKLRWSKTIGNEEIGRPVDLFQIKDKGEYKLTFELQLFVADGPKRRLVRFPPVEYSVFHE